MKTFVRIALFINTHSRFVHYNPANLLRLPNLNTTAATDRFLFRRIAGSDSVLGRKDSGSVSTSATARWVPTVVPSTLPVYSLPPEPILYAMHQPHYYLGHYAPKFIDAERLHVSLVPVAALASSICLPFPFVCGTPWCDVGSWWGVTSQLISSSRCKVQLKTRKDKNTTLHSEGKQFRQNDLALDGTF